MMNGTSEATAPQVLISETRNHTPRAWADASANLIVDFGDLVGDRLIEAQKLHRAVSNALEPWHRMIQQDEIALIHHFPDEVDKPFDETLIPLAVDSVLEATIHTPWETHFHKHDVVVLLTEILRRHNASNRLIERQWYVRDHPAYAAQLQDFLNGYNLPR